MKQRLQILTWAFAAARLKISNLLVLGECMLVTELITKNCITNWKLQDLFEKSNEFASFFTEVKFMHIKRSKNRLAQKIANESFNLGATKLKLMTFKDQIKEDWSIKIKRM